MKIKVKLFSSLMEFLPPETEGNTVELSAAESLSCNQAIERFRIPGERIRVIMRNGEFLPPAARDDALSDGDTLAVWPAIQGG